MVASRLRLRRRGSPRTKFKFKESCAEEIEPKGAFPQGFATDDLLNGLSWVVGLPLSVCRCRPLGRSWLAAVGLPLPSGCRFAVVALPLLFFGPQLACRSRLAAPLGLSVCNCRLAAAGLRTAAGLPQSAYRARFKFEYPSICR